jgi:putative Ca2+/H+ antiporter (TMEM165/GDT1 family)
MDVVRYHSLTVSYVYCAVHRQVVTSNAVLLHPQSSERAGAAASKTKRWDKRKSKETKRGVKRERVTFFAAQYDLDEPLLKQFVMFMAAECADKTSTDFIEVSSHDVRAIITGLIACVPAFIHVFRSPID